LTPGLVFKNLNIGFIARLFLHQAAGMENVLE